MPPKMDDKFRTTIWVSRKVWEEAGKKLPSRSSFIENQLRLAAGLKDEEKEIIEKIDKTKKELNVLRDRLCSVQKMKEKSKEKDKEKASDLEKALDILTRMNNRNGCVGENQINDIAILRGIEFGLLLQACIDACLNVVKYFGDTIETKRSTGFLMGRFRG